MLSFPILPNLPPAVPPTTPRTNAIQWAVVRVTNIPWDVSLQDMLAFFAGFPHPPEHLLSQNVHILMDRSTGKTFNSAFVELALTPHQAGMVAQARNLKVLKGRLVTVELSSQDELMRSLFPKWAGQFQNGEPLIHGEQLVTSTVTSTANGHQEAEDATPSNDSSHSPNDSNLATSTTACTIVAPYTPPFVTRDEINSLLLVCRNYKEYNNIQSTLLHRMVRSAILTAAFTERQKNMVLHVAGYTSAPEDLAGWMSPLAPVDVADADAENAPSTAVQVQVQTETEDAVEPSPPNKRDEDVETVVEDLGMIDASKSAKSTEQPSTSSPGAVSAAKNVRPSIPVSWAAVAAPCNNSAAKLPRADESGKEMPPSHTSNSNSGTRSEFAPRKMGAQRKFDDAWLNGPANVPLKNVLSSKKHGNAATQLPSDARPLYLASTDMTMSTDPKRKFSFSNQVRHNVFQEGNTERCTGFSKSL
ncbi:hypothetical protein BGZ68_007052 [Mortierella alpina]|nr:hypothetical protein BGZ68_007052 [Mortierella alpina]